MAIVLTFLYLRLFIIFILFSEHRACDGVMGELTGRGREDTENQL